MTDSGQTREASAQTASRSNPQAEQQTRQGSQPSEQSVPPPAWDSTVDAPSNWEPAKDAAIVPVETGGSDTSIGFEWKQVAIETNRTCSCLVSVEAGHLLSVRVQQPPYDRTLKGTGSVTVAAIPLAGIGAMGRLVAKDEVSGVTAEFTWEWKPVSNAKWADPSREMGQSAAAVQAQPGATGAATKKAGASSKTDAATQTQGGAVVQTGFFGTPAIGRRFAFILDMSGSMAGTRWSACIRELEKAFESLTVSTEIIVVLFSDRIIVPHQLDGWLPATDENKQLILGGIRGTIPNGGTYPKAAFDLVFAAPDGKPDVIYFLTDGVFTDPSPERLARLCSGGGTGVLSSVKELFIRTDTNTPNHTVIHTLALDVDFDGSICEKIARATGGRYARVSSLGL